MDLVEGDEAGKNSPLQEVQVRPIRSFEELRAAIAFAQRAFGLSDHHRGGFFDYYTSRFAQQSDLMVMAEAEGEMVGIVLSSIQGNHILVGEVAVAAAYQRRGIGSRMLVLVEQHARRLGYQRLLLGTADAQDFYLKNGYVPLLWLHVEDSGVSQMEQALQTELRTYPLIWKPAVWKQGDRQGLQLALQTSVPDEALRKRIEQAVPTCRGEYLFAKGMGEATSFRRANGSLPWSSSSCFGTGICLGNGFAEPEEDTTGVNQIDLFLAPGLCRQVRSP